jgi:hypothetical protein
MRRLAKIDASDGASRLCDELIDDGLALVSNENEGSVSMRYDSIDFKHTFFDHPFLLIAQRLFLSCLLAPTAYVPIQINSLKRGCQKRSVHTLTQALLL